MRAANTTTIVLAALLAVSTASRTAGAAGGSAKEAGKGASAPAAAAAAPSSGGTETTPNDTRTADRVAPDEAAPKTWEVGASYEYHRLLASQGTDAIKGLSYIGFYGRWDVTKYDRLTLRGGAYQSSVIDTGDSPMRFDDLSLAYTRRFPLVSDINLRLTGAIAAPTSYASQRATMIISPRLALSIDRKFGRYFTLDARVSGSGYIVRCATEGSYDCMAASGDPGGAMPNAKAVAGATLSADLAMPFHDALSIGASGYTGYIWFYSASGGVPVMSGLPKDVLPPANSNATQPVQQSWGAEVYIRYAFPSLGGFKTDVSFALANGDPTKGYGSVLHDGVQHIALGFRQTAEVYGVVGARY